MHANQLHWIGSYTVLFPQQAHPENSCSLDMTLSLHMMIDVMIFALPYLFRAIGSAVRVLQLQVLPCHQLLHDCGTPHLNLTLRTSVLHSKHFIVCAGP